ncbi:hypothetical protein SM124_19580 [Bacillus sp. 31A1R]|uniref:Sortilin, neurotensin receptor 3 n=1 Tax=Robertmurraya mangrovi TaxID=3098077 RepID=A0ABU5J3C8_9BACI|nr:hypothetical protein [Bacillus sp. 31A1R]MDZ5473925.1 hypothetical protein [Bacillus sp. 31A1R]
MKKCALLLSLLLLTGCTANEEKVQEETVKEEVVDNAENTEENKTEDKVDSEASIISSNDFFEPFKGKLDHVHGIGYVGNANAVFFAAHDGLKVYENNKWFQTKDQNHDYMGFNAVKDGFFTSGHPAPGSKLPNPFGIKMGTELGENLESIVLEGEIDFHVMGVGYESNTIYAMNPHANSLLKEEGALYISEDKSGSWKKASAKGLGKEVFHLTAHPTNPDIVAVAAKDGIYLSTDKGESFNHISKNQGTTVFLSDHHLYYSGYNGQPTLVKLMLETNEEQSLILPSNMSKNDAVMYLAQNPKNLNEIIFITFEGDIFITEDEGNTWHQLSEKGNINSK